MAYQPITLPASNTGNMLLQLGQQFNAQAQDDKQNARQNALLDLATKKDARETQAAQLDAARAQAPIISRLIDGVTDQASYDAARQTAAGMKLDVSQLPANYADAAPILAGYKRAADALAKPEIVPEGGTVVQNGKPVFQSQPKAPPGFARNPDGSLKVDPEYLRAETQLRQAGRPTTEVKVNNDLGGGLAGEVKTIMKEGRDSALSAVDAMNTVNSVRSAMDGARLGPGATLRNSADQLAQTMGLGGADTAERLAKTREVVQGLAKLALSSRGMLKGQGAITDFEQRLLSKATTGNGVDDLTAPELDTVLGVAERAAQTQYGRYQDSFSTLQGHKDPAISGLAPFYKVPELPQRAAKAAIAPANGPAAPKSKADFDALPSGTQFVAPDGSLRVKP